LTRLGLPHNSATLLGLCAYYGLVETVRDLIVLYQCDPKLNGYYGLGPLHALCSSPEPSSPSDVENLIKTLVTAGTSVNLPAIDTGNTPLHFAAEFASTSTIDTLLSLGADVNARNMEGNTPLLVALTATDLNTFSSSASNPRCVFYANFLVWQRVC